jgi:hypothetical protein
MAAWLDCQIRQQRDGFAPWDVKLFAIQLNTRWAKEEQG